MRKTTTFVLAGLLLHFCNGLVSCAYGQSLVFGPEFFSGESGKSQRVVKRFSIQDASQKFIVSVQSGMSSDKGAVSGAIEINGERIVSAVELGNQFKMFTKPVKLQKQNVISVEVTGEADAPIIVTIMSQEERTVTAKIPPIGEAVDIVGYASVIFPSGTFEVTQDVMVSTADSPSTQGIFEANYTVPRLPYEIRINTGDKAPGKDIEVSVNIPESFVSSNYQIHIFSRMRDNPAVTDEHDRFFMIASGVDEVIKTVSATLPKQAFSNRYGKNGTYEAIISVGLVQ